MGTQEGKNAVRAFAGIFGVVMDGLSDLEAGVPVLEIVEKSARRLRKKRSVRKLVEDVKASKAETSPAKATKAKDNVVRLASFQTDEGIVDVETKKAR